MPCPGLIPPWMRPSVGPPKPVIPVVVSSCALLSVPTAKGAVNYVNMHAPVYCSRSDGGCAWRRLLPRHAQCVVPKLVTVA